ncbi:SPT3 Dosage dependent suppressor of Ty-induced promoter mutations-like protein, partial [Lobosporangium transversale]
MSETDFIAQTTTAATSASISTTVNHQALATNNFYARSLHTPFFQMGLPLAEEGHFSYSTQGSSVPAVMNPVMQPVGNLYLPAFDVKAYTFRKKSRHYVAVKHKNALRIEPIIYLKTSILDPHREIVRNWDYLRFSIHRFKENAFPKKKLSMEEMRTARILDVNISLVSPNNNNRPIEESCPACVMRMDGERKIMQVLAKNFKMTHLGEPVIDIRKGHAIVCIKLNCYCDHHNEHEGFVVRMQTEPEVVQVGGSVKLRICCEARSKGGPTEVEAEEEEGLTDIDAPVSTGSRSPLPLNDQSVQSPSLSYGSQSPDPRTHRQRQPSSNSSSTGSPRSVDERPISSVGVDPSTTTTNGSGGRGRGVVAPPKFRQIYPLTPSEGTCLGGTRVTIHGANFDTMQNPAVYFGKVPAELVTISHHDVMECTTPPAEGLKPGIVAVRIVSSTFPLGAENDSVDYMYMAPLDYDFYNLAATSLSYAMSNEYPNEDSLSYILNAHGTGMGAGLGLAYGSESFSGNNADIGLAWAAKEDVVLDFLRVIQTLAPGRILPAFKTESGCTLLHLAAYHGMIRLTKELLAMGIDHTALDRNHKSALHFAQLSSHAEVARILSEARIPPRPMVPRLGTASGSNSIRPPTVKAVADLVQKHETTLRGAVVQHQEAKAKELDQMRERSLHIMGIRGRTTSTDISNLSISTDIDGDDIAMFSGESSPSTKSFDGDEEHIRSPSLSSMPSPPRKDNSQKRKVGDDELPQLASGALKRPSKERTNDFMTSSLSDARLAFIQNGVKEWESINRLKLPRDVSKLTGPIPEMDVQVWVCESAAVSMIVSDSTASDASLPPILTSSESTFTALALSTNGIHLYLEQQNGSVMRDSPSKKLQHWNLIEIDALKSVSNELEDTLTIDMCGLVPRRGRDLSGERLSIKFNSVNGTASEVLKVIEASHGQSSNQQEAVSPAAWIQLQLKIHGALFNVNEGEVKSTVDDYLELKDGILTLKAPRTAGPRFSLGMIGAVFRVAQKLQSCTLVQFDGVQIVEDGWSRPELTKILEATVRSMKEVLQWRFNACGWTTSTVEAFVKGLEGAVVPKNKDNYHTQQSKSISLADNSFGGEDTVGHLLVGYFSKFRGFKALDLSNCDIGLAGMEALVNNLSGLTELRLQGNWADDRWWQWMDAVLENNRQIQLCSIGAPVPCSNPLQSVLSLERLESLENLVELDLAETIITQPTLDVLEAHVRQGSRKLQMLNLSHCQLNWLSLSSLFKAICDVNRSTKSTLNVSKNPLFDSDAAIQEWITSVEATKPQVPFGIQMMDLILSDVNLQRILAPLERATCFNELNVKGLYVTRPRQEAELQSLPYDEARAKAIPGGASKESCLALG